MVSIIMPCHNGSNFLRESIDSVINQTYQKWELLIIDDNSTDNSMDIIKQYEQKDNRIKGYSSNISIGSPSVPRNIGIKEAKGKFIAFLDCDDIWSCDKLEKQIPFFSEDEVSIVFSYYEKIDSKGNRSNRIITAPGFTDYKNLLKSDVIGNLTGIYNCEKVGKFFQKNEPQEDYIMWLEILKNGGKAVCVKDVLAYYRVSKNSLSSSKFENFKWQWNTYRKVFKLNFFYSIYLYCHYAIKGLIKFLK